MTRRDRYQNRAPNGRLLNWLKSAVAAAGALTAGDLRATLGPERGPRVEPLVGGTTNFVNCNGV